MAGEGDAHGVDCGLGGKALNAGFAAVAGWEKILGEEEEGIFGETEGGNGGAVDDDYDTVRGYDVDVAAVACGDASEGASGVRNAGEGGQGNGEVRVGVGIGGDAGAVVPLAELPTWVVSVAVGVA